MSAAAPGDIWRRFAEVERQVSRIYYRFSHLFLDRPELRDFWWEMAREEEQHACILIACQAVIANFDEDQLGPDVSPEKARELYDRLAALLGRGQAALSVEEAFGIALDIEGSEIDAIYSKLIHLGGPQIAKTMENLGVPAAVQRQKIKAALRRYCNDPELLRAAERL